MGILCKLKIHKPIEGDILFWDKVNGKAVIEYTCKDCKKVWMAQGKYTLFKCYKKVRSDNSE